ncbi:MAG: glycosyltransferase family 39 protein [Candidatus Omnitrophica bacterium]|nr:glycosyltransferase family 39 protein [Candidatus Omnitrophota bacterium]
MVNFFSRAKDNQTKGNFILLFLIFITILILRLPYATQLMRQDDEQVYFTAAWQISEGAVLYKDIWDHKGPLLYFLFVPVIKCFGPSIIALRIFTTVYLLITMFFIYRLAKLLFLKDLALITPLAYGLFFSTSRFGLISQGELFMLLPITVSWLLFLPIYFDRSNSRRRIFLCGVFVALAFLIKSFAIGIIIVIVGILIKKRIIDEKSIAAFFFEVFIFFLGFLSIHFIFIFYFFYQKALIDYFYGFYVFNRNYIADISWKESYLRLSQLVLNFKYSFMTVLAVLGSFYLVFTYKSWKADSKRIWFVFATVIAPLTAIVLARRMNPYYTMSLGLGYSLIVTLLFDRLKFSPDDFRKFLSLLVTVVFFLSMNRALGVRAFFKFSDQVDSRITLAEFFKKNTNPSDTIFCYKGLPIIYFLCQRAPSVKYFNNLHYTNRFRKLLPDAKNLESIFVANKPNYIVVDTLRGAQRPRDIDFVSELLAKEYRFITRIERFKIYSRKKK